jgi:hypothetical protein
MYSTYYLIFSILVALLGIYIVGVFYLLKREPLEFNGDRSGKIQFEHVKQKYTSLKVYEEADLILKNDPNNLEVRAEILTASFIDHHTYPLEKAFEHAWWFLENAPLNPIVAIEGNTPLILSGDSEDKRKEIEAKVLSTWKRHLSEHPKNIFYLRAAANSLKLMFNDESKKIYMQIFEEYPFCSKSLQEISRLEQWSSPHEVLYNHPTREHKKAYTLDRKRVRWPWHEFKSSKLVQLKFRYGKILFPNWLCFLTLYIEGFLNWGDRPWTDYLDVSDMGMLAYQCGEYSFAKKCAEQFLKLEPEAYEGHPHRPLYATGFNLVAMLALREENFQLLESFLDKRAEDEAESVYAFHSDTDFLIELTRLGRSDIAANFMKKRARNYLTDPDIAAEIAYVENGGRIYSEEYLKWLKERSENKRSEDV